MGDMEGQGGGVWKQYRVPIVLGSVSTLFIIVSITILIKSTQTSTPIQFSSDKVATVAGTTSGIEVAVDVSGGVIKPGVYTLPSGSRVEDAIRVAGGLSAEVDRDRLEKSVNRAAKLSDGAKIYIPKVGDTQTSPNILTGSRPVSDSLTSHNSVSINTASQSDLEALSGIGPVIAKKIINGRPFASLEELVAKKAMGQALFDKLKAQLTL